MAFAHGAYSLTIDREVLAPTVGIGVGAAQAGAMALADAGPTPPPNFLAPITDTGGEAINLTTGSIATAIGVAGAMGKGLKVVKNSSGVRVGLITYGLTTLLAGFVVPKLVKMTSASSSGAAKFHAARIAAPQLSSSGVQNISQATFSAQGGYAVV